MTIAPVKITELCEVVAGGTPDTGDSRFWGGNICWATPKDLSDLKNPEIFDTSRKLTRQYGQSILRGNKCGEVNKAGKVGGLFLISRGHSSTASNPTEEPLDHVAVFIPLSIVTPLPLPRRIGPYAASGTQPPNGLTQRIAVIGGVGNHVADRAAFHS